MKSIQDPQLGKGLYGIDIERGPTSAPSHGSSEQGGPSDGRCGLRNQGIENVNYAHAAIQKTPPASDYITCFLPLHYITCFLPLPLPDKFPLLLSLLLINSSLGNQISI